MSEYTLVSVNTVMSERKNDEEMEKISKSRQEATKRRTDEYHKRANGRKLVRKYFSGGPCIVQGILLRETAQFYVFAEDAHMHDDRDIKSFPEKRLRKSIRQHVEPCKRCEDHPQTRYPEGW